MDFGGTIIFRTPIGNLSVRGSVTHNPVPSSYEGGANHDYTTYRTVKPEGFRLAAEFENRDASGNPVDLQALMALQDETVTFICESEKVRRTFLRVSLEGDPQVDDLTGAISGITGRAAGFIEVKL